jgi:hypothetical protein
MKFEHLPSATLFTTIDSALQCRLTDGRREFAAAMSVCHLTIMSSAPRSFPPPWSVEELDACQGDSSGVNGNVGLLRQ